MLTESIIPGIEAMILSLHSRSLREDGWTVAVGDIDGERVGAIVWLGNDVGFSDFVGLLEGVALGLDEWVGFADIVGP